MTTVEETMLASLVRQAHGMMPMEAYLRIHDVARTSPGSRIIEVGTGHGAATIALALGTRASGRLGRIQTIDPMGGRHFTRSAYGTAEENREIVLRNLRSAGVDGLVELFLGTTEEFAREHTENTAIDILLLDADGRIDRDLLAFGGRLPPGSWVIVDDSDDTVHLRANHQGLQFIDLKHRITRLLLDAFLAEGWLADEERVGITSFCRRTQAPFDLGRMKDISLECYRALVFTDLEAPRWAGMADLYTRSEEARELLRLKDLFPTWLKRAGRRAIRFARRS